MNIRIRMDQQKEERREKGRRGGKREERRGKSKGFEHFCTLHRTGILFYMLE